MNKNNLSCDVLKKKTSLNHFLLIMRTAIILLFTCVFISVAETGYTQNAKVTLNKSSVDLKEVLNEIESQTDYLFIYNNEVNTNKKVSVKTKNGTVRNVLTSVLKDSDIDFSMEGNHIILSYLQKQLNKKSEENTETVQQQGKTITGTIVDAQGETIIGANIIERGTSNGTITDFDGKFTLQVGDGAVLRISYIGYLEQEVPTTGKNTINVTLVEDTKTLDELVVVGYGIQRKENLTGAVSTITSKSLTNRAISNVSQGLQGLAPGLTVTNSGGQPGQDKGNITIRGLGTFNVSSPLVLIDGIEGDMNIIDPQDIENISILKDASSAAIYGSKAANGVILITTKRGESGETRITYNAYLGWSSPSDLMKRTSSAELAQLTNEAEYWDAISQGVSPEQAEKRKLYSPKDIELFANGSDPYGHPNTDWYGLFYVGSGFMNKHNLSFDGGSEWIKHRTSIGYSNQEGIVKNSSNRQYYLKTNLDLKLTNRLKSKINLDVINTQMKEPTNPISWHNGSSTQTYRQINRISPMVPYKNEDGSYGAISDGNPIAFQDLGSTGDTESDQVKAFTELSYDIIEGLLLRGNFSYSLNNQEYTLYRKDLQYNPSKYDGPIRLNKSHTKNTRKQGDILLSYDKLFSQKHTVNSLLGFHSELFEYRTTSVYRQNYPSSDVTDLNGGSVVGMTNSGYTRELAMNSVFGRLKYNYSDKYLFEGNLRGDASSRFAKNNRMGWFPSFSGAWRVTNESFMAGTNNFLTDMKLRGSWGILGNQEIRNDYYPYINTYSVSPKYPFDNKIASGAAQTENKIEGISWEKTRTWGVAADIILFNDLSLTLEYYNRKTTDILMQVNVPVTYGYGGYWDNVGEMQNHGFEIQFNYNKNINKVSLNINGNFAYNINEVLSLGNIDAQKGSRDIVMVGKEYRAFYGYKSDGIFQSQEEIDKAPKYTMINNDRLIPGDIKLVDVNGDGVLDEKDKIILSSESPKYTFAFNIGATWENFDVNLFFQGAADVSRYFTDELYGEFNGDSGHPSKLWLDRWTPENLTNKWPRASKFRTYNLPETTTSDFWLVNTNYLRLKDIQFGYSLPKQLIEGSKLNSARIYYSGSNLLTFKKAPQGVDPEAPAGWGAYYPHIKTHSFGVSITF